MNYSRQASVFNQDEFKTPVSIIGAGATGSWIALMLSKLGVKFNIYDFDIVEEHNLPNQAFEKSMIGQNKALAIKEMCEKSSDIEVNAVESRVKPDNTFEGIVIVATDTMKSREYIYKAVKNKIKAKLLIESRMAEDGGFVYAINPLDVEHQERYEKTLFDDDVAEVSACGISQSVVATATNIASLIVWTLINYANKEEIPFCISTSYKYNNFLVDKHNAEWYY